MSQETFDADVHALFERILKDATRAHLDRSPRTLSSLFNTINQLVSRLTVANGARYALVFALAAGSGDDKSSALIISGGGGAQDKPQHESTAQLLGLALTSLELPLEDACEVCGGTIDECECEPPMGRVS